MELFQAVLMSSLELKELQVLTVSTRIPILHPIPLKINSTQIEVHM
nr:MAG TPA: hypothetical protein [Caudoviricetes sp.]